MITFLAFDEKICYNSTLELISCYVACSASKIVGYLCEPYAHGGVVNTYTLFILDRENLILLAGSSE